MDSKALIGGTVYEIDKGKTLVNGTAYEINKGKTLINGTAYKIERSKYYNVTMRGRVGGTDGYSDTGFSTSKGYVTINGNKYATSSDVQIIDGTQVSVTVGSSHSDQEYRCYVELNGVTVHSGAGTYHFTPTNNCQITVVFCVDIVNWTYIQWYYASITM